MLKKIGVKLLLSYLVLLIVAFSVSSITFNFLSKRYILAETRQQLNSEGQIISELLTNIPLSSNAIRTKLAGRTIIKSAQKFVEADMLIINKDNEVIFKSLENLDKKTALKLMRFGNKSPSGYLAERIPIYDRDGNIKGYLILFSKLNNIYGLNRLMRGAELASILAAGFVALIISLFFKKNLVKPIIDLTNKINKYSATKQLDASSIRTGDEIQQLDECFVAMTKSIASYDNNHQKFLQNTSHELKTPLMSIQGYAEAIKDGVITGQAVEEGLEVIIEQSQRLKKIVDELIYLTRLENPEEKLIAELTNMKELIYSVCQSIKPLSHENNISIEIEVDAEINIICDREKMHRALLNILGNGIRYANNTINISNKIENKSIKLFIQDDGCGFKTGEENKIFERFYKGERGSTGLGLSIVKAILEAHGGRICAYNGNAKGAVFEMQIPLV